MTEITPVVPNDLRAFAQAFLAAKKEFLTTGRSGKTDRYKYAKIEDIYHATEQALANHNIVIWHYALPTAGIEYLYTRLTHVLSGQYIEDCRILESEKPGNQAKGAANTYMRRYALLSLCAIPTEDDDCESEQRYLNESSISSEQIITLQKDIKSAKNATDLLRAIYSYNRVTDLSQLKASSFESVRSYIAKNRE